MEALTVSKCKKCKYIYIYIYILLSPPRNLVSAGAGYRFAAAAATTRALRARQAHRRMRGIKLKPAVVDRVKARAHHFQAGGRKQVALPASGIEELLYEMYLAVVSGQVLNFFKVFCLMWVLQKGSDPNTTGETKPCTL